MKCLAQRHSRQGGSCIWTPNPLVFRQAAMLSSYPDTWTQLLIQQKGKPNPSNCWVNKGFWSQSLTISHSCFTSPWKTWCTDSMLWLTHSDLLTQRAVAALSPPIQLKGLPQQRVERLASAVHGGGIGGHREGSHVAHLLQRAVALGGLVKQLVVL